MNGRTARRFDAAALVLLALVGAGATLVPPDIDGIPGFDDSDETSGAAAAFFVAAAPPVLGPPLDAPRFRPTGSPDLEARASTEDTSATLASRAPPRS